MVEGIGQASAKKLVEKPGDEIFNASEQESRRQDGVEDIGG